MAPTPPVEGTLLILPTLSWPFQRSSLRTAYRPTIQAVLRKIFYSGIDQRSVHRLDIALVLTPSYLISPNVSRAAMFPQVQALLEETYSLICVVAAQERIELDFPGGVDARIFLLEPRGEGKIGDVLGKQSLSGPLIDVRSFAASGRQYATWYAAEGEDGAIALEAVLKPCWSRAQMTPSVIRLPYGTAIISATSASEAANSSIAADITNKDSTASSNSVHTSVAVGGTFDHLHIGHKLLLSATVFLPEPTAEKPRHITVGTTGDELLVNKKFASQVGSWEARQAETAAFVESILIFHPDVSSIKRIEEKNDPGPNGKAVVVHYGNGLSINYAQISDPFGPTITDESITALIISKETRAGGKAVNDKREEKGWKGLEVFEVDVLDAKEEDGHEVAKTESFDAKISSTDIRRRLAERAEKEKL
jgi:phosphopantetheine adenylyltransferase